MRHGPREQEAGAVRLGAVKIVIEKNRKGGPGQVAQLVGASSAHQKVVGSIPGRGAYGRQLVNVSLSLSQINKHVLG